jgi:hypothetical protein
MLCCDKCYNLQAMSVVPLAFVIFANGYIVIQVVKKTFIGGITMQIRTSGTLWGDFKNTNEGDMYVIIAA